MSLRKPRRGISIRSCLPCVMTLAGSVVAMGSSPIADDYIRTNFTVEDGLPDNVVNAIVQTGDRPSHPWLASPRRCGLIGRSVQRRPLGGDACWSRAYT